jgi:hypothetical protein
MGRPGDLKVRGFLDAVKSVGRMSSWIGNYKKYAAKWKLGGVFVRAMRNYMMNVLHISGLVKFRKPDFGS